MFTEDGQWYLLVHTKCKHLQDDNRCGIYDTRPQICRDYTTDACEYDDDWTYERYFETPEQIQRVRGSRPAEAGAGYPQSATRFATRIELNTRQKVSRTVSLITPRTLKGFRDYLPATMMPREQLMETAKRVYRSYGFSPIDTPALEYLEILQGKGSEETDRQLYQFVDHGGRAVGLRFDLTVPLARFVAQHAGELGIPFKRYHIATVWRGENTQRGRYREFMQCDFDTIGTTSVVADIETALVIHDLLLAIGFSDFTICINNRMVLNGLLEKLGLADQSTAVLRALDKLTKIGPENVIEEMQQQAGATRAQATEVLRLGELRGTPDEILRQLDTLLAGSDRGTAGVENSAPGALWRPGGRRARAARETRRVHRPRARLLHRHDLRNAAGSPSPTSAASARADGMTISPDCSRNRSCRASVPHSVSTACWPRWKNWG